MLVPQGSLAGSGRYYIAPNNTKLYIILSSKEETDSRDLQFGIACRILHSIGSVDELAKNPGSLPWIPALPRLIERRC